MSELSAIVERHLAALPDEAKQTQRGVVRSGDFEFAPERMPWERQPGETDAEFAMFVVYRDLPGARRTLNEAYRAYTGAAPTDRIHSRPMRQIAAKNRWAERVEAYVLYTDEKLRAALEEERVRVRLKYLDIGRTMREKATEALAVLETLVYETDPETGEQRVKSALSVRQIIELTRAAHDYERFALLMDQWNTPAGGATVNILNVTDTQLLRDAKEVLGHYENVGVIVDATDT